VTELAFFFDYASPFAYLAATQVERLAEAHRASLRWRPLLLGGLFKAIGTPNVPLFEMPESKRQHALLDMQRWADHYGVPFRFPSHFPMNTIAPLRMTLQLPDEQRGRLARGLFAAYWAEDRHIGQQEVLCEVADAAGFDGRALFEGTRQDAVKAQLREETEYAQRLGVCGAPSFLVREQGEEPGVLFWGQDRLLFVEKALQGWRPAVG
jgi:2-hydroxychromene-2-carboxylate isomerase